ncbi:MAG: 50S ribosomal protein L22 [Candidatus Omnitrophota bacterium]
MIASAKARHIRMSARKARFVIDLIRGQSTNQALAVLQNTEKRAAQVIDKLLRSAIANAKNKGVDAEGLFISKIYANEGATWKRFQANAFGRGSRILKRTCHINVELDKKMPKSKIMPAVREKAVIKKEKIIRGKTQTKAPVKKTVVSKSKNKS